MNAVLWLTYGYSPSSFYVFPTVPGAWFGIASSLARRRFHRLIFRHIAAQDAQFAKAPAIFIPTPWCIRFRHRGPPACGLSSPSDLELLNWTAIGQSTC